jgi:hypothetical protein
MQSTSYLFAAAFVLLAAPTAFATPDVTDPRAAVPRLQFESTFADYQSDQLEMKDWRQANADVAGGGHAGHGMEGMHSGVHEEPMDHSMHGGTPAQNAGQQADQHRH